MDAVSQWYYTVDLLFLRLVQLLFSIYFRLFCLYLVRFRQQKILGQVCAAFRDGPPNRFNKGCAFSLPTRVGQKKYVAVGIQAGKLFWRNAAGLTAPE